MSNKFRNERALPVFLPGALAKTMICILARSDES